MTLANALSQIRFVFAFRAAAFVAVCANAGQDKKQKANEKVRLVAVGQYDCRLSDRFSVGWL